MSYAGNSGRGLAGAYRRGLKRVRQIIAEREQQNCRQDAGAPTADLNTPEEHDINRRFTEITTKPHRD